MNKLTKERNSREVWTSQTVPLFDREQVDKSVQLLVACGEFLSPTVRANRRQWLDIRARALIAAKLSTIYESQLGKSNTPYGKAKLWAELAARWMINGNYTVALVEKARKEILQLLRAHPPSGDIVLKTFQTIYNRARIDVKKGSVPIDKLAPFVSPLPSSQSHVTVQALKFAKASAHAIRWSDYLKLKDEVKRQLDIIKRMPNAVIIFNKLKLQLREDWQQQWAHAESNQILAFYEMNYQARPVEESNRYIEALVGVSYSFCKGQNIMDKWLNAQLRRIQKKLPNFKIKDCVSIEDINTFTSGYIKSEIPINDVYEFLKSIYFSLNKAARKVVNIVMKQAVVQNYSHAVNFGTLNANTKYKCLSLLLKKVPRAQWVKIAQIAVDLQRDPWHALVKARIPVKEFIDLANFGKIGMSILHEKFKTNFQGFIHDGILSKEEILDLVERARSPTSEDLEDVLALDGILLTPALAHIQFVVIEDRIFTYSSTSNTKRAVTSQQDEKEVLSDQKSKEEEEDISLEEKDEYQHSISRAFNLQQENSTDQQDELIDVLEQFKKQLEEDIQQRNTNSANNMQQNIEQTQQNEAQEQDIQQRKINTLINLQKEVQRAQQHEQKDILEQFYKQQDVFLQRYKKISISGKKEVPITQQDNLNDFVEQFNKQKKESILQLNSATSWLQKVRMAQQDGLNDPNQFRNQQEDDNQQCNTNSTLSLQKEAQIAPREEQQDVLEPFGNKEKEIGDVTQCTVQENKIVLERGDLPKAAQKLPGIGIEITKTQLPELYGRAIALIQEIKAARVLCKYLNIVGRGSVFHPFVKRDRRRHSPSRFRPIPAELRYAAAIFGVKVPDDPVEDNLNDGLANELTKAPRPVITEISFDIAQLAEGAKELCNAAAFSSENIFNDLDENNLNEDSYNELTKTPSPGIIEISSDVEQHTVEARELCNPGATSGVIAFNDPDEGNLNDGSVNEVTNVSSPPINEMILDVEQLTGEARELCNPGITSDVKVSDEPDGDNLNDGRNNEVIKVSSPRIKEMASDVEQHSL